MVSSTPNRGESGPEWRGSPLFGYDSPAVQSYYTTREAARVADFFLPHLKSGMSLLDCGCGPGAITLGLAEAVAPGEVVGVDLEPGMVEQASAFAKERLVGNVRFQVGDINELPFPGDSFDAAYTSSVLEHLADPVRALQELYRVLKPAGLVAVISTDWAEPLISPPDRAVSQFFEVF